MDIPKPDAEPEPDICGSRNVPPPNHNTRVSVDIDAPTVATGQPTDHGEKQPGRAADHAARPLNIVSVSPSHEVGTRDAAALPSPGIWASLKATVRAVPPLALVPVLLPVAWALHFSHQPAVAVFVASLLAVAPLAGGLGFATEQLALRIGDSWGGLLNASFGNAVELLVAILALVKGDIGLVQASMAGSVLSNILLVLGMSYFAGGLRFHEQEYALVGAQTLGALLGISMAAVVLPAAYHWAYPGTAGHAGGTVDGPVSEAELADLLAMSRGLSVVLLAVYAMYLVFTLWTHAYLFRRRDKLAHAIAGPSPDHDRVFPRPGWVPSISDGSGASDGASARSRGASVGADTSPPLSRAVSARAPADVEAGAGPAPRPGPHDPKISLAFAVGLLVGMTALAGLTAECLVESIDGLTATAGVTREFVGLVLLPVVGNAVEHVAAVSVSVKDRLDLALAIAVGSSVQVALALLPVLVLVGWAIGQPMTLRLDTFETAALVLAVALVNWAIADGRTNYLEGFVLMMAYVCIALVCWFYDPAI